MSVEDALRRAGAKPAGKRPLFLAQENERVLAIAMAVAQELSVTRQRVDTLERLLDAKGVLSPPEIEAFTPTPAQAAERALWTQEYLVRILRFVQQEGEAAAMQGDLYSEEVAVEVAADEG